MNAKHTPGPWNWHGPYMTGAFKVTALAEDDAILCQVYITGENAVHDAHLIAAAPDLLAALEAQNHMGGDLRGGYCVCPRNNGADPDELHATNCVIARAAIARAKG